MITDDFDYLAPGGRSFTLTSGLIARLSEKSRVLEIASGKGEAACALAQMFKCKVEAFDIDPGLISYASDKAYSLQLAELMQFEVKDGRNMDFGSGQYDLILAEGGALSYIGRETGIERCASLMKEGSYLALTDLIYLKDKEDVPTEIREIYEANGTYAYLNELDYRRLLEKAGFEIDHLSMLPQSAWDRYYMSMRQLFKKMDIGVPREFMETMAWEIEVYYEKNAMHYVGYVYIVARLARDNMVGVGPEDLRISVLGCPPVIMSDGGAPAKSKASAKKVPTPKK